MAVFALTNANIYVGTYDLSSDANKVSFDWKADPEDSTTFGTSGYRSRIGGLGDATFNGSGFVQMNPATGVDGTLFPLLGTSANIVTVSPDGADGSRAYSAQVEVSNYQWGDAVGSIAPFSVEGMNSAANGVIPGYVLATKSARGTSSTGTITNIGATSATQRLFAALHVFTASGTLPTLDVTVKSAALVGFGSPTTRITFAQQTAAAAVWATPVSGAITDAFYRVDWTIAGTTPSFTFAVVVGIR